MSLVKTIKRSELTRHSYVPPEGSRGHSLRKASSDDADLEWAPGQWYDTTDAEDAAGIVPADNTFPSGYLQRYSSLQDAHDGLPDEGGIIYLPPGTTSFDGLILTKPVLLLGQGGGISDTNVSPTILSYTGTGVAIDWRDGARGSCLKDFQLINSGSGTIGILCNGNDPRMENLYLYQTTSGFAGFSVAAIRVGTTNQVNDLLMRDVYIRQQPGLGLDLWDVSEATFDHVRLIQNFGWQIKIGDTANGKSCNGLNFVNGTSPQTANSAGAQGCVVIERSFFKLVFDHCQFESDNVNGTNYSIDASGAAVCDTIFVRNCYFTGSSWGASQAYGIAVNLASTVLDVDAVYAKDFSTAFIKNTSASKIWIKDLILDVTPLEVDAFSAAVQQWSGLVDLTLTGCTTSPTMSARFTRNKNIVTVRYAGVSATSNTTAMTLTGIPAGLTPASQHRVHAQSVIDNGNNALGRVTIETSGVFTYAKDFDGAVFTNAGTKGPNQSVFTYTLD